MDATSAPQPPAGEARPVTQAGSFAVQLSVPVSSPASLSVLPSPPPVPSILQTAWPRPAQWALAALLGLAAVLLGLQGVRSLRWGSRPTEREHGLSYRIDLNEASHAELLQLPGVGEKLAGQIERYREAHGGFRKVEDLLKVSGVGATRFEIWRPWICVGSEQPDEEDQLAIPQRKSAAKIPKPASLRGADGAARPAGKATQLYAKININRASAEELQRLPRIGPKLAQRIIDEREKRPFQAIEDLRHVSGIGPKTLEQLRPYVIIEKETTGKRR